MADNQEKTEAELLEETMQNLGLEPDTDDTQPSGNDETANNTPEETIQEDTDALSVVEDNNSDELEVIENDELEAIPDNSQDELTDQPENSDENALDENQLEDEDYGVQKKQGKLHKILIGVVGVLLLLIIAGAVMYFMGFFDPEPVKKPLKSKTAQTTMIKEEKKYEFKEKDIDVKRLNKKLNLLTKYEIVENDEKEAQKASEKEKLYQEAKRQLEAERQEKIERIKAAEKARTKEAIPEPTNVNNVEEVVDAEIENIIKEDQEKVAMNSNEETSTNEMLENNVEEQKLTEDVTPNETMEEEAEEVTSTPMVEETQEEMKQETMVENEEPSAVEEMVQEEQTMDNEEEAMVEEEEPMPMMNEKSFIKFIKISTQQKEIYKSFVDQLVEIDNRVILCRDDRNLVEIFVGPFDNEDERKSITQEYNEELEINAEIYDFTEEEYNKRCNY